MEIILYILSAWVSMPQFASAANNLSGSERENAMRTLIAMVRREQLWPSRRPDHRQMSESGSPLQSPMISRGDRFESMVATQSTYDCFNSILSAIVPKNELTHTRDDLKLSLLEKYCSERLPADLRAFLAERELPEPETEDSGESLSVATVESKAREWRLRGWNWRW